MVYNSISAIYCSLARRLIRSKVLKRAFQYIRLVIEFQQGTYHAINGDDSLCDCSDCLRLKVYVPIQIQSKNNELLNVIYPLPSFDAVTYGSHYIYL